MNANTKIRPSPIAGTWYSDNPQKLSQQIDNYLANAEVPGMEGQAVAVIAPHAGYRYSGRTAGYAFKSVQGAVYDLVVVVSPLHGYHPASILTSSHLYYATPLGEISVDQQIVQELNDQLKMISPYEITAVSYDEEHSLEIELPFLQRALVKPFRLLPLMLRTREKRLIEALGTAIAHQISGKSALLVASSDLSHFYPAHIAENLDGEVLRQVEAFSPEGVLAAESKGTGFACGAAAVSTVLYAAWKLGANTVKILHYSTSADETGDTHSVVGYGAAVVLKTE